MNATTDTNPATAQRSAMVRVTDRLTPQQTIYLILRHVSRRGTQSEVAIVICDRPGYPEDLTADVAAALRAPTGAQHGVMAVAPPHEVGAWITSQLNHLCGYDRPETALRFHWL